MVYNISKGNGEWALAFQIPRRCREKLEAIAWLDVAITLVSNDQSWKNGPSSSMGYSQCDNNASN